MNKILDELYLTRCEVPSDIYKHLPTLYALAAQCAHITEFGVRSGNSTVAFLDGLSYGRVMDRPILLVSYDINVPDEGLLRVLSEAGVPSFFPAEGEKQTERYGWEFRRADTATMPAIYPTDMLFIDTLHTYRQVEAELRNHHDRVRRYIALHDVSLFPFEDEDPARPGHVDHKTFARERGVLHAVLDFLIQNPHWRIKYLSHENNGLMVLERR